MTKKISFTLFIIYRLIIGLPMIFGMFFYGYLRSCFGKATKFTNLVDTKTGKRLSWSEWFDRFDQKAEAMSFTTDQGKLAVVHGSGNGGYVINGQEVGEEEVAAQFEEGEWNLTSCCNGLHRDFAIDGKVFRKVENTNTEFETLMAYYPNGTLITWGGKDVAIYSALIKLDFKYLIAIIKY